MLRASWFFAFFLVTDAFVLPLLRQEPPTPMPMDPVLMKLMMVAMPIASMLMAFKSLNMMILSNILEHKFSAIQSYEEKKSKHHHDSDFLKELLEKNSYKESVNDLMTLVDRKAHNTCDQQPMCKLTVEQQIVGQEKELESRMNMRRQKEYDEALNKLVDMNVAESAGSESFCGLYGRCPYGVENISLGLARHRNSWSRWWTPRTGFPFIMDDDDFIYNYYPYLML